MANFGDIVQIGYLTADIEAAMAAWTSRSGVGPFTWYQHVRLDAVHLGAPTTIEMEVAIGYRGDLQIEFFRKDDLDPRGHDFGCCLRVADLPGLFDAMLAAGVPQKRYGLPSVRPISTQPWGQQMATMLDPDGNLLRMIADDDGR